MKKQAICPDKTYIMSNVMDAETLKVN